MATKNTSFFRVSTHSRLKAAGPNFKRNAEGKKVSTHSRLKAAGTGKVITFNKERSFNTQPPEGGWIRTTAVSKLEAWFQHTAA